MLSPVEFEKTQKSNQRVYTKRPAIQTRRNNPVSHLPELLSRPVVKPLC